MSSKTSKSIPSKPLGRIGKKEKKMNALGARLSSKPLGRIGEKEKKTKEGEGEKKVEEKWSAAIGLSGIVALLGALDAYLCISSQIWDDKFMNVIEGYDTGNLLWVLGAVGVITAMVGAYGIVLCLFCKKPGKASRLRWLVYAYFGWGWGTVCLLIASAVLTYLDSGKLEVDFQVTIIRSVIRSLANHSMQCIREVVHDRFHELGHIHEVPTS